MKKNRLQAKFGKALYDLAEKKKKTDEYFGQLVELAELSTDKKLREGLSTLSFAGINKVQEVLRSVLGEFLEDGVFNMLVLLTINRQVDLIPSIKEAYQKIYFQNEGFGDVLICTSRELGKKEKNELNKKLKAKFGKVYVNYKVDNSLIGGMQIYQNGRLTDFSLKNQLEYLRRELLRSTIS